MRRVKGTVRNKIEPSLEGTEWVAFRQESIANLMQALIENFGESPTYSILYHTGLGMGRRAYQRYVKEAQSEDPVAVFGVYTYRKRRANWGTYSFHDLDTKKQHCIVKLHDGFEKRIGAFKDCPLTKGYLNGFFSAIFNTEVTITEHCTDTLCEFHVKGSKTR